MTLTAVGKPPCPITFIQISYQPSLGYTSWLESSATLSFIGPQLRFHPLEVNDIRPSKFDIGSCWKRQIQNMDRSIARSLDQFNLRREQMLLESSNLYRSSLSPYFSKVVSFVEQAMLMLAHKLFFRRNQLVAFGSNSRIQVNFLESMWCHTLHRCLSNGWFGDRKMSMSIQVAPQIKLPNTTDQVYPCAAPHICVTVLKGRVRTGNRPSPRHQELHRDRSFASVSCPTPIPALSHVSTTFTCIREATMKLSAMIIGDIYLEARVHPIFVSRQG